jgi:hypothetical protein
VPDRLLNVGVVAVLLTPAVVVSPVTLPAPIADFPHNQGIFNDTRQVIKIDYCSSLNDIMSILWYHQGRNNG